MSIINSDGKNTNWQFNVLKGLQGLYSQLVTVGSGIINIVTSISNILTLLTQIKQLTSGTTIIRPTTSGTIVTGQLSVSIANVGTANGTVKGVTVKPGETVSFSGGGIATTLDAIAYNATGTEFLIITVYPL